MSGLIEHFLYGTPSRIKALRADLPAGIDVAQVPGGLVLQEVLGEDDTREAAIGRMEQRANRLGVTYDGHGQGLSDAAIDNAEAGQRNLQVQSFTSRTGIKAGHGFAFPLPDGRMGHAVHLGSDRRGYLLLDILAVVAVAPVEAAALQSGPRRYRQPILVWHTPFAIVPLADTKQVAAIPREVSFRAGVGWPDPVAVARLAQRYRIADADNPEGWNALVLAMAEAAERLPDIEGYGTVTARVGRTGLLKLIEDYETQPFSPGGTWPMPWQPVDMTELGSILAGAPDLIAARDDVT
jgi:hypothetical protein